MDDAELAQIRARRMAELQARKPQAGGAGGLPSGFSMPPGGAGRSNGEDEEKKAAAEEMRKTMLMSVLDNDARERLARIAIVKPQNARAVEDMILRMAQTGQLRGKVDEDQLIDLLGNISESKQSTKIVYNRRKALDSDDDGWD